MTRSTLGTELMSVFQFPGQKARKTAPNFRALALGTVKALVSIALIAFLATRLNYTQVLAYWRVLNGVWILGALAVLLVEMCVIAGVRLKLMLAYVDVRCPLTTTVQIALCGFFADFYLISSSVIRDAMYLFCIPGASRVPEGLCRGP